MNELFRYKNLENKNVTVNVPFFKKTNKNINEEIFK